MYKAGIVNMAPATITPELAPIDWMMTFCPSEPFLLNAAESPTARIAMGIAASKTWPIFNPEYAAAAEKRTAITKPQPTDHGVTSA